MANAPRVFISYSYDSDEHAARVLALADALCAGGIDVILDRYVHPAPEQGWPRWMDQNIEVARFILLVCTEIYRRRVMGQEEPGKGLGVRLEGSLIYIGVTQLYRNRTVGGRKTTYHANAILPKFRSIPPLILYVSQPTA